MELEPTPTRESDFDREFRTSVFDYMMDQVTAGSLTFIEAMEAFHETMDDVAANSEQ